MPQTGWAPLQSTLPRLCRCSSRHLLLGEIWFLKSTYFGISARIWAICVVPDPASVMRLGFVFYKLFEYEWLFGNFRGVYTFNASFNAEPYIWFPWSCAQSLPSSQIGELTILSSDRLCISTMADDGSFFEMEPFLPWLKWRFHQDPQVFVRYSEALLNFIFIHFRSDVFTNVSPSRDQDVIKSTRFCRLFWLNKGFRCGTHAQMMPRSTSRSANAWGFTSSIIQDQSETS